MSWVEISDALNSGLRKITPSLGNVHDYIRWTDSVDRSADFETKFFGNNPKRLQFWMATYLNFTDNNAEDADDTTIRQYDVILEGFLAHNDKMGSEKTFKEDTVESVAEYLRLGDSTLDGVCNTRSNPSIEVPRDGANFYGVASHYAKVSFKIEEILKNTSIVPIAAPASLNTGLTLPISQLADAMISTVAPAVVPLVVPDTNHITFYRGIRDDPVYPANPRLDLPRIRLRMKELSATPVAGRAGQAVDSVVMASFCLYILQIPGQDHQRILANAVKMISKPFLGNFAPPAFNSIAETSSWNVVPGITRFPKELNHPWGDPTVRVSCAIVQLKMNIRLKTC